MSFCLTLASVYLSTKWSMESITGLRELRGAPPGLAGQPPCRVRHCLSHPLSPQAQLSRTGAERVVIYFFILFLILSHTSFCLTIQPVVHGKHHRIERTKRCATGAGRTASLPCLALSIYPPKPRGPHWT